jgi:arsenite methyltransferase
MNAQTIQRADYGIDAPPVIHNLAIVGVAAIAVGTVAYRLLVANAAVLAYALLGWGALVGLSMLVTPGLMIWSSKVGKLRQRERLIETLALKGNETALDVGCGRGYCSSQRRGGCPRGRRSESISGRASINRTIGQK